MSLPRGALGRRRGQIDDPANTMAPGGREDRDLRQHIDIENALSTAYFTIRTGGDRCAAFGDEDSDPFRVHDVALNNPEPFLVDGQELLRSLRQLLAVVQRHVM